MRSTLGAAMNLRPAAWTSWAAVVMDATGCCCSRTGVRDQPSMSYMIARTSDGRPCAIACRIASRLGKVRMWELVHPAGTLRLDAPITIVRSLLNHCDVTAWSRLSSDMSADVAMSQLRGARRGGIPVCVGLPGVDGVLGVAVVDRVRMGATVGARDVWTPATCVA